MPPLGFTDEKQFLEAAQRFRVAAGAEDALVGIRGSASPGRSGQTGATFGAASDLDFFLVSDILYQQALAAGAQGANGALRVGATQRYFPALAAVEKSLSSGLGRKTTVRIFSQAGYDLVKAATDIVGG
jgi:hypothetical protein